MSLSQKTASAKTVSKPWDTEKYQVSSKAEYDGLWFAVKGNMWKNNAWNNIKY